MEIRVRAAQYLIDRGFGKPAQAVAVTDPGGGALGSENLAALNAALAKMGPGALLGLAKVLEK